MIFKTRVSLPLTQKYSTHHDGLALLVILREKGHLVCRSSDSGFRNQTDMYFEESTRKNLAACNLRHILEVLYGL